MAGRLDLVPWEEARERVIHAVSELAPVPVPVAEAHGLTLATGVRAEEAMPPFANSAMDGFAVLAADVAGASRNEPVVLEVVGELPAGRSVSNPVTPGKAVRVMTGAPIPEGADAVVPVEATNFWDPHTRTGRVPETAEEGRVLRISRPATAGAHIRAAGESVRAGEEFLESGHRIRGAEIALLLSVGVKLVNVHPLPRVGVLSTGDELVEPDATPGPGQIRDSNRIGLLRRIEEFGFPGVDLGLVRDDPGALASRILESLPRIDFLLTSGGVSVGDYDFTRRVLAELGAVEAYRVAVKPGKPQVFGNIGGVPVFGLPGNPVSSMVVFDQFVHPGLRRMAGRLPLRPPVFTATLEASLTRSPGRTEFLRVRLEPEDGAWVARTAGPQGSGVLSSMTKANGYAIIPPEVETIAGGGPVPCQLMRWD